MMKLVKESLREQRNAPREQRNARNRVSRNPLRRLSALLTTPSAQPAALFTTASAQPTALSTTPSAQPAASPSLTGITDIDKPKAGDNRNRNILELFDSDTHPHEYDEDQAFGSSPRLSSPIWSFTGLETPYDELYGVSGSYSHDNPIAPTWTNEDSNDPTCAIRVDLLNNTTTPSVSQQLLIRIITPELARTNPVVSTIAPLSEPCSLQTTLQELESHVRSHLTLPRRERIYASFDCNCAFAQTMANASDERDGSDALRTLVMIHDSNRIVRVPIEESTFTSMREAAKQYLGTQAEGKHFTVMGGVERDGTHSEGEKRYLKLPVMAVCAQQRHAERAAQDPTSAPDVRTAEFSEIDLHVSECPIHITTHNSQLSLMACGLQDCAVDGVLNIYVVRRIPVTPLDTQSYTTGGLGRGAIFKKHSAWEHPNRQTDRGFANLLSTLRVFAHLTARDKMDDLQQDAVLHIIYLLTRFPPAVRAAYVLMRGETPDLSERAALAQCLYEILKTVIPFSSIQSDAQRYFEGSRLLFGLILEKAKQLKVSITDEQTSHPYAGMKVYDLRNAITSEPVLSVSIQSDVGLLDVGLFDAVSEGKPFAWAFAETIRSSLSPDHKWRRAAILSGGTRSQVVLFDSDAVAFSTRYSDEREIDRAFESSNSSTIQYLANPCSQNGLSVVPPSDLPSAQPPVLTLDRQGYLAVYVGREACGTPGSDILMFRPEHGEETVDVSIITQLLVPIISLRNNNGSNIFEAYGNQHRQLKDPEEIIMVCVDVSKSMDLRCGFEDVEQSEDDDNETATRASADSDLNSIPLDEEQPFDRAALDQLKEYLLSHESFEDFLAIVRAGRSPLEQQQLAEKVLKLLQDLDADYHREKSDELNRVRQIASHWLRRNREEPLINSMTKIKDRFVMMKRYSRLLCALLVNRACLNAPSTAPVFWRTGDAIPRVPRRVQTVCATPVFQIPAEYLCPISSELLEDPVLTVDNHTYERRNIERWFLTSTISPLTTLALSSLDLRPDVRKREAISAYIDGSNITSKYLDEQGSYRAQRVLLRSPRETWALMLPCLMSMNDLYALAFQITKGEYPRLELHHRNALLASGTSPINEVINRDFDILITPVNLESNPEDNNQFEELCLIKIYLSSYAPMKLAYWEPRTTTKTLSSVIFRYYRFMSESKYGHVHMEPLRLWYAMKDIGDGQRTGQMDHHWDLLATRFSSPVACGGLHEENMIQSEVTSQAALVAPASNTPIVIKLELLPVYRTDYSRRQQLSRLEVLKQMFDAFINRVLAYNFQTHIGLLTFNGEPFIRQNVTHAVENFRDQVNDMTAGGDTAIWQSISLAHDHMKEYARRFPKARLRIICISDGKDNKSSINVRDVYTRLLRDKVTLDAFCLGKEDNLDLRTLAYSTHGYNFQPSTLEEAMAICELEPVLSIHERPLPTASDQISGSSAPNFRLLRNRVRVDVVNRDTFPKRKEHPQLSGSFVELGRFRRPPTLRTNNNLRLNRIHAEMRDCGARVHPHYDIYMCEQDFGLWKVVMQGPPGSIYDSGVFLLYIEMGPDYPSFPPKARFQTPIYHPNINRHGRVCHSILDRNWTADTATKTVLDTIYSLLLEPEFSDPINVVVTLNYRWDEVAFRNEAQRHITTHAGTTRAQWRERILNPRVQQQNQSSQTGGLSGVRNAEGMIEAAIASAPIMYPQQRRRLGRRVD